MTIHRSAFLSKLRLDKTTLLFLKFLKQHMLERLGEPNETFPAVYHKVEDFINMIKSWWSEISLGKPAVGVSKVAAFFTAKSFISSHSKSMKLCGGHAIDEVIDLMCFENIFLRAIFIAQLMNIKHGVEMQNSKEPIGMKMAIYQRNLLIHGADPEVSRIERTNLNAVYQYQKKYETNTKSSLFNLQDNLVVEAEKVNKHKLEQIIYDAEHKGVDFVGANGNMKNEIKATWDLKNAISEKEQQIVGKFYEKNYLKVLKNSTGTLQVKEPYSRHFRIFRDNFLFKKFQIVANKFPKLDSYGLK